MSQESSHPERKLSEDPAVEVLSSFGYQHVPTETLNAERESRREAILIDRLEKALRKLNPWLDDANRSKAVRTLTNVSASSLLEANEKLHIALTAGIAAQQKRQDKLQSPQIRYFDFDQPQNNDLLLARQFPIKGTRREIIPDLILYINGIPLAVIECKSPTLGEQWKNEAIDQLGRAQELTTRDKTLGAPHLFHTVQLLVVTCGQDARYATVGTPARYYRRWREPYPLTTEQVEKRLGRTPTPQDLLLFGTLTPENLLDLTHNFIVFDRDTAGGGIVKKVARHHQLIAVNNALARVKTAGRPEERGGVIWHTQGSGKSLTMQWLAQKLRNAPETENPTLLIVTDRRDLDKQICDKLVAAGYPNPEHATSVRELRRLLSGPGGRTVLTTVQKFQEAGEHPRLSEATNIFVLADEAHRTQYGSLAANLRAALPNAVFFGFTGTPIDKKDRSTLGTFGPYLDRYTIEKAVADEATVPIYYESRLPELRIVGQSLDNLFEQVFADYRRDEREAIKQRYANERTIAESSRRIEAICRDLLEHYRQTIEPGGFKAQIVAVSREAVVIYKETLDRLDAPASAVIFCEQADDKEHLTRYHTTEAQRRRLIKRFKRRDDPLKILIVCDMLITGFDAPIEQVMYLDAPLREHTLLQAIARVNRTADKKDYGLVVDYWGVSAALQDALAIFVASDVEGAMTPKHDELPRLERRHAKAMRLFANVQPRGDFDACVRRLEPEDVRAEFELDFRRFSQSMDLLFPDPRALPYLGDLRWLGKIRQGARARFHDDALDLKACADKVRQLIEDAIVADGVGLLVREVSILAIDFEKKLEALASDEAKASEMEHGLRHEIHVRLDEDPAFYLSLRERLEKILADRKADRIGAARQLELFQGLVKETRSRAHAAESQGLSATALAIFGVLGHGGREGELAEPLAPYGEPAEARKTLAAQIEQTVSEDLQTVDWARKEDLKRDMRRRIKRHLAAAGYDDQATARLAQSVLDLLQARKGR